MNRAKAAVGWLFPAFLIFFHMVGAQPTTFDFPIDNGKLVEIRNPLGRIEILASEGGDGQGSIVSSGTPINLSKLVSVTASSIRIEPQNSASARVDLSLRLPVRTRLRLETTSGEIRISGYFSSVEAKTETGTIITEIPTDDVAYRLQWNQSRPRIVSDFDLEPVKEQSAGRFIIKGRFRKNATADLRRKNGLKNPEQGTDETAVTLNFSTDRGIILLNVPPAEVMNNLGEKPLTEAAKAIIRSGDGLLMESIRRASPKYFAEYMRTLPPLRPEPSLISQRRNAASETVKGEFKAIVRAVDSANRAVAGLGPDDFQIETSGRPGEILEIKPATAPVNLVLLLDVSGSVENYTTFIRKAARAFIETVDPHDRVSIIIFNEDVKSLVSFTSDKRELSSSLDTFDAGGGTAYYDAIAFVLTETLRPLKGERTAIVILTDGDDNRSFLPFEALIGSIEESGALIYPLYVPTGLIAAGSVSDSGPDPLRSRYLGRGLTSQAEMEGKRLAAVSGGIYYPISRLSEIQDAYNDIAAQLRTAYEIRFLAEISSDGRRPDPRFRIRTTRPNVFVQIGNVSQLNQ